MKPSQITERSVIFPIDFHCRSNRKAKGISYETPGIVARIVSERPVHAPLFLSVAPTASRAARISSRGNPSRYSLSFFGGVIVSTDDSPCGVQFSGCRHFPPCPNAGPPCLPHGGSARPRSVVCFRPGTVMSHEYKSIGTPNKSPAKARELDQRGRGATAAKAR